MIARLRGNTNYVILSFFAVVALYPLIGSAFVALSPQGSVTSGIFPWPSHFTFSNFSAAWHQASLGGALANSAVVAIAVTVAATVLSTLAGYAFGTLKLPAGRVVFYLFLTGLIMPYESMIIPLYFDMRRLNLVDSYWSLILPETALYLAFGIFWMRAFFQSIPSELLEAARIDGASNVTILRRVLVPIARPAISTMTVLFFVFSWNEFLLPLVMLSSSAKQTATLALGVFQGQYNTNVSLQTAAALSVAIPVIVIYVLFQRQFIRGMLSGSLTG
ncbi:MAG: ABC-type sugar transport system, permease component [Acidimicrobiaceae bacterium]|nr:ABC-type sugar transport system, permease component [Acidimicrobiaceae bacterium]